MRTVLIAVFVLALLATPAMTRGNKNLCETGLASILNECAGPHTVNTDTVSDKQATEIGVGIDLILLEGSLSDVSYLLTGEYRYDINNSSHSAYGVITLKLQELAKGIKGLFK